MAFLPLFGTYILCSRMFLAPPPFFYLRPVTHSIYYAPFEIRPDTILLCSSVIKRKIRLVLKSPTDDLGERGDN